MALYLSYADGLYVTPDCMKVHAHRTCAPLLYIYPNMKRLANNHISYQSSQTSTYREPRESDSSILDSEEESQGEQNSNTSFANAGGSTINANDRGFNFATVNATSRQEGVSGSYNFSTKDATIRTQDSFDFNFASNASSVTSTGSRNANFNVALGGSIENRNHSHVVSFVSGDTSTQIQTAGTSQQRVRAFNIATGSTSRIRLDSGSDASINLVASGGQLTSPRAGINVHPGNEKVYIHGHLDMQQNTLETQSIISDNDILIEPGHDTKNGNVKINNMSSGSGAPLVIDNGVVYEDSSSRRYKQDIRRCSPETADALLHVSPVSFVRAAAQQHRDYGLIAEDVAQFLPDVVIYEHDGNTPHSIKYTQLIALLIELAQEQAATIKQQDEKLQELTQQVTDHKELLSHIAATLGITHNLDTQQDDILYKKI